MVSKSSIKSRGSPGRCINKGKNSCKVKSKSSEKSLSSKTLKKTFTKDLIKKIAIGATAVAALGATGFAIHHALKKIKAKGSGNGNGLEGEEAKNHVLKEITSSVSQEHKTASNEIKKLREEIGNEKPDIQMEAINKNLKKSYVDVLEQEEKLKEQALKEIVREFSKMKLAHLEKATVENICDFYRRSLEFIDRTCEYAASKPACIKRRYSEYGINGSKLRKNLALFGC